MLALASLHGPLFGARPAFADGDKHAAMIVDANTGAVLHADDADELRHPASLTKMMTLYLAFEMLDVGRMSMSDRVVISANAAAQAPSKLGLEAGESISVSEAIRALVTKSANDVAVALAEKIGGSERNFVRLMNARARDLGMSKTTFQNPSGLPDKSQVTTARDMVTLGMRLQDHFPNYYPVFATRSFAFNRATYRNHNTLLNSFQGIDGIKTGYTRMSGFNLVSSVRRGGRHVVGAVFGGATAGTRNAEMRVLLTRALARASTTKTRKPAPLLLAKLKAAPALAERPKRKDEQQPTMAAAPPPTPKPFAVAAAAVPAARPPTPQSVTKNGPATIAEAAALPDDDSAPIDVFKVKRVKIAPRQGPPAPVLSADDTTDMSSAEPTASAFVAGSSGTQTADAIAATFAGDGAAPLETVIPKTRYRVANAASQYPGTAERDPPIGGQIAMLGARDVLPEAMAEAPEPDMTPPSPQVAVRAAAQKPRPQPQPSLPNRPNFPEPVVPLATTERGRAPSSLQAQAAQMPQRVAALQTAAYTTAAAPAQGRFEVQIGAFGSIGEAQRALSSTQARTGKLLAGYGLSTHPVQKSGRTMYRARFSGFDATRASSTCTELRRQSIDCFVMSAE